MLLLLLLLLLAQLRWRQQRRNSVAWHCLKGT